MRAGKSTIQLAVGVAVATLWGSAVLAQPDVSRAQVRVEKVAGAIYMLSGDGGGNIAAVVGADGIVVVDDQYAPMADRIRAALKGITDQPVRFIINTHHHDDHAGGNAAFAKDAVIVAQDNVRKRLAAGGLAGNGGSIRNEVKPAPAAALPIVTFGQDLTLHLNGEEIRALHAPHGHTDGDSMVFFPRSNVAHMGDLFVTYGFPFIDISAGGSSAGIIAALERATQELPADVKVIPGHGPVSTLEDVRKFLTMLKETRGAVAAGVQAGKSLEQLKAEKVLARWDAYSGPFITTDLFIETLYNELTGKDGGTLVRHN